MRPASGAASGGNEPPQVLEIRVHGVSNTPPHQMLGLEADEVVRAAGDDGGSFWVPKPEVLAQLRDSPDVAAEDFRLPPAGVRREAYSWGSLARLSTVPGLSSASGLIAGIVRAFWVLIIPFGMVNAAYWARRLDGGPPESSGESEVPRDRSLSGGLVRLFGWVLTMLWTSTALTVTLGTVAARCYVQPEDSDVVYACAALPSQMDALARWTPGARAGLLAAAALVAVLGVGLVGLSGAVRFDRRVSAQHGRDLARHGGLPTATAPRWPFLARTGLWSHAVNGSVGWAYHVSSAMGLVGLALTVQLLAWGETSAWPAVLPTAAFAAVVVYAAVRVTTFKVEAPRPEGSHSRVVAWLLLVATAALLVGVLLSVRENPTFAAQTEPWRLELTTWAVPLLIGLLAVLVVAALGLRTAMSAWWPALVAAVLACAAAGLATLAVWPWLLAFAILAAYAVLAARAPAPRRADGSPPDKGWRAFEGWGGAGPAVFLSLAAGFALVLSGAVVTGTVSWLGGAAAPERSPECTPVAAEVCAADNDPLRDPVRVTTPGGGAGDQAGDGAGNPTGPDVSLPLPRGYDGFSLASLVALAAFLLSVLLVGAKHLLVAPRPLPVGAPGDDPEKDPNHGSTQSTRRLAALAHRAEPLVAILAVALWVAIVLGLVIVPFDESAASSDLTQLGLTVDPGWHAAARAVVVAAFALLVTSVVLGGSGGARTRPWGLLWDLTCFLPRVAHPFAAPSYAERAVPELRGRIDEWLAPATRRAGSASGQQSPVGDPDVHAGRRVVVAAHSMGAVVSVATLFARQLTDGTVQHRDRIALLTFGTQLRAYFGRFFPELLGPDVLGTDPCRRARLWAADPWVAEREPRPGRVSRPRSLVGFLASSRAAPGQQAVPRWRSLWRRTDYIGFPVDAYLPSPPAEVRAIDHRSAEVDPTTYLFTVGTHGGDFRTPEYRVQLLTLVSMFTAPDHGAPEGVGDEPEGEPGPATEYTR